MNQHLIDRLAEEWVHLDPADPLRGLISDAIAEINKQPAQRTWVGLTDEERMECFNSAEWNDLMQYAEVIEAKLKEKNV